jgi:hypothetical protein
MVGERGPVAGPEDMHSHKTNNSNLNSSKDKESSKMANILAAEPNAETGDVAQETGIEGYNLHTNP